MAISLTRSSSGTWVDEAELHLKLPPKLGADAPDQFVVPFGSATIFVGPNGAGKSRMAGWIDRNNDNVIYIRARRSIVMPNSYSVSPEEDEFMHIIAGHKLLNTDTFSAKNFRYSPTRDAYGDDDYQSVLNILGSKHTTSALKFREQYRADAPPKHVTSSEMDIAIGIWSEVLPHLSIDATNAPKLLISRTLAPSITFEPKEMSDGEKAIFYLVAKCMIAPSGATIIVDEPEMYVHRSVRGRLWNAIERARRDCVFIYFTHDLNFVRTRQYEAVFNVRSYASNGGEKWEYSQFSSDPEADETLQISVWGSRQSTLLVEGERNSLDFGILSLAYPGIALEPAGGCGQVIDGVAALRRQKRFHHQSVYGLIDADFRDQTERASLSRKGVHSLDFREIENLLVCKDVLRQFSLHFGHNNQDFEAKYEEIMAILKAKLSGKIDAAATELSKRRLINLVENRMAALKVLGSSSEIVSDSDVKAATSETRALVEAAMKGDLDLLLSVFSVRKDDFGQVFSKAFNLKDFKAYTDLVIRLASDEKDPAGIMKAIRKRLPSIS